MTCASQLQNCPLCRAEISKIEIERNTEIDTPTSDDFLTWSEPLLQRSAQNLSNKSSEFFIATNSHKIHNNHEQQPIW